MHALALWRILVVLALGALCHAGLCAALTVADEVALALPTVRIVRYLPAEGKLVIWHEGRMLVVRQGEELPGGNGRMIEATRDRVVISVGAAAHSGSLGSYVAPERVVILARSTSGAFEPIVYAGSSHPRSAPVVMALPQVAPRTQSGPMGTIVATPPTPPPGSMK